MAGPSAAGPDAAAPPGRHQPAQCPGRRRARGGKGRYRQEGCQGRAGAGTHWHSARTSRHPDGGHSRRQRRGPGRERHQHAEHHPQPDAGRHPVQQHPAAAAAAGAGRHRHSCPQPPGDGFGQPAPHARHRTHVGQAAVGRHRHRPAAHPGRRVAAGRLCPPGPHGKDLDRHAGRRRDQLGPAGHPHPHPGSAQSHPGHPAQRQQGAQRHLRPAGPEQQAAGHHRFRADAAQEHADQLHRFAVQARQPVRLRRRQSGQWPGYHDPHRCGAPSRRRTFHCRLPAFAPHPHGLSTDLPDRLLRHALLPAAEGGRQVQRTARAALGALAAGRPAVGLGPDDGRAGGRAAALSARRPQSGARAGGPAAHRAAAAQGGGKIAGHLSVLAAGHVRLQPGARDSPFRRGVGAPLLPEPDVRDGGPAGASAATPPPRLPAGAGRGRRRERNGVERGPATGRRQCLGQQRQQHGRNPAAAPDWLCDQHGAGWLRHRAGQRPAGLHPAGTLRQSGDPELAVCGRDPAGRGAGTAEPAAPGRQPASAEPAEDAER